MSFLDIQYVTPKYSLFVSPAYLNVFFFLSCLSVTIPAEVPRTEARILNCRVFSSSSLTTVSSINYEKQIVEPHHNTYISHDIDKYLIVSRTAKFRWKAFSSNLTNMIRLNTLTELVFASILNIPDYNLLSCLDGATIS